MPVGGRPKNPIWEHFQEINIGTKKVTEASRYSKYKLHILRMIIHTDSFCQFLPVLHGKNRKKTEKTHCPGKN